MTTTGVPLYDAERQTPVKLRLHEGGAGRTTEDAAYDAWGIVADGYDRALETPGLSLDERSFLVEQRRDACLLAGRAPLSALSTGSGGE